MAWLEQYCEVCGGGGFCYHRSNLQYPDLNQAACPREGAGTLVQELQFFGGPGGGVAWELGGDAGDGEGVSEYRSTPRPPIAPAAWYADDPWPPLDGGCSVSAGSKKSALAEAGVVETTAASAGASVPFCGGGGADATHADATEAAFSGKDVDDSRSMDREARVLRYREKKKRRKFGKQIRYASRKAYAEARPRIRGRFVKALDGVTTSSQPPPPPQYDAEQIDMGWLRAFRS